MRTKYLNTNITEKIQKIIIIKVFTKMFVEYVNRYQLIKVPLLMNTHFMLKSIFNKLIMQISKFFQLINIH